MSVIHLGLLSSKRAQLILTAIYIGSVPILSNENRALQKKIQRRGQLHRVHEAAISSENCLEFLRVSLNYAESTSHPAALPFVWASWFIPIKWGVSPCHARCLFFFSVQITEFGEEGIYLRVMFRGTFFCLDGSPHQSGVPKDGAPGWS